METVKKNRRTLILIAAISILPVVLAYGLYKSGWRPTSFSNYGDLVQPVKPIKDTMLILQNGKSVPFSSFHRKWTLIYFGPVACPEVCQNSLYKMRQVHLAQGKHQDRLQRLFIVLNANGAPLSAALAENDAKLHIAIGSVESVANLTEQFTLALDRPNGGLNRIYLVDPMGNLMMSYGIDADPSKMKKDLVRLLKVSHIG